MSKNYLSLSAVLCRSGMEIWNIKDDFIKNNSAEMETTTPIKAEKPIKMKVKQSCMDVFEKVALISGSIVQYETSYV